MERGPLALGYACRRLSVYDIISGFIDRRFNLLNSYVIYEVLNPVQNAPAVVTVLEMKAAIAACRSSHSL